jgi:hypothetical protein
VVKVAIPARRLPVPMGEPPSRNVTVPVGVPAPGATTLTVAVTVTDCPYTEGLAEEVTVVLVSGLFTCWDTLPLLVVKASSPL